MVIDIKILIGVITIIGGIVTFFSMQTRQNMKIEQLQKEVKDLKKKLSEMAHYQIETEKAIIEINVNIQHIADAIEELKNRGT